MHCPSCLNTRLKAMRLDDGLPVYGCGQCEGTLIPLLSYRDWAERTANLPTKEAAMDASLAADHDSKTALHCPKCSKIMTKYQITGCQSNRLDLCDNCDEAWLDQGEWALLKALQLSKRIPKIFTQAWQSKVSHEVSEMKLKARFSKLLAADDLKQAEAFRSWLNGHKNRAEILFYVSHE